MNKSLGRVPNDVSDRLFGVDLEQVLQYIKEWNLLRRIHRIPENCVKDIEM